MSWSSIAQGFIKWPLRPISGGLGGEHNVKMLLIFLSCPCSTWYVQWLGGPLIKNYRFNIQKQYKTQHWIKETSFYIIICSDAQMALCCTVHHPHHPGPKKYSLDNKLFLRRWDWYQRKRTLHIPVCHILTEDLNRSQGHQLLSAEWGILKHFPVSRCISISHWSKEKQQSSIIIWIEGAIRFG